jgi:arginyl-tRNA synthetase
LNDLGKQLAVVVWGLRKFGLNKRKKIDHAIAEVYVKANKELQKNPEIEKEVFLLMKMYEEGKIKEEFQEAAQFCMKGILQTLKRIGVTHDSIIWESKFVRDGSVQNTISKIKETNYAKEDGAFYVDLSRFGIDKELVLIRADGTSLYPARDIAYHIWKSKRGDVIDILGADHKLLSRQISAVLEMLGEKKPTCIIYEFINLPEGGMSTRKGFFFSLDDLLDESISRAWREVDKRRPEYPEEIKRKISEALGVAAVRFNIARVSPDKPMSFRLEDALDFEKQGAPFIQYAFARACRILEKAEPKEDFDIDGLSEHEVRLLKAISKFPWVVGKAAEERKPHVVATYAIELADSFHRFYMFEPVLKSGKKDFRLSLVEATKIVTGNVLHLLGILPLTKM